MIAMAGAGQRPDEEPVAWLREPGSGELGRHITGLTNALAKGIEKRLASYRVSPVAFTILSKCLIAETTTVTELGKLIPMDTGYISRVVNDLCDRGLLVRERVAKDRRVVHLRLSEEGRLLTPELIQRVEEHNAMLVEDINEAELRQFVAIAQKIIANYQRSLENGFADGGTRTKETGDAPR